MALEISSLSQSQTAQAAVKPGNGNGAAVAAPAQPDKRQAPAVDSQSLPPASNSNKDDTASNLSKLEEIIQKANESPKISRRSLEFKVDKEFDRPIITIRDVDTDEVIRQIPPEEIVEFSKYLREVTDESSGSVSGLVVRTEA